MLGNLLSKCAVDIFMFVHYLQRKVHQIHLYDRHKDNVKVSSIHIYEYKIKSYDGRSIDIV